MTRAHRRSAGIKSNTTLQVFLLFGRTGWIGGLLSEILKQNGKCFEHATARLEDRAGVLADIERVELTQYQPPLLEKR